MAKVAKRSSLDVDEEWGWFCFENDDDVRDDLDGYDELTLGERWLAAMGIDGECSATVESRAVLTVNEEVLKGRSSSARNLRGGSRCWLHGGEAHRALSRALVFDQVRRDVESVEEACLHPLQIPTIVEEFVRRSYDFESREPELADDAAVAVLGLGDMLVPVLLYASNILGVNLNHVPDSFASGYGLLHSASESAHPHVVRWLLQARNLDASAVTKRNAIGITNSETPLHIAARANRPEVVAILVENGADVEFRTRIFDALIRRDSFEASHAHQEETKKPSSLRKQRRVVLQSLSENLLRRRRSSSTKKS